MNETDTTFSPTTEPDLRADEPWFDLDTSLILLAGIIVISFTGIFFSARRLDSANLGTTASATTYSVGAAGVAASPLTDSDIIGTWSDDELTFIFHEAGTVDILDDISGDFLIGTWDFTTSTQVVTITLTDQSQTQKLIFNADRSVMILSDQQNSTFHLGIILTKN